MTAPLTMYVAHEVPRPVHDVSLALDQLAERTVCDGASLTLDGGDTREPTWPFDPWRSLPATLRVGRIRPPFRVRIEAVPWSETRSQIAVRPRGRACRVASASYFDAAHALAAHIGDIVLDSITSTAPTARPGELSCQIHDVDFDHGDGFALVKVAGDLYCETSGQLRDEVIEPIDAGKRRVLVDLAGLRSVDSAGLATLALVSQVARRAVSGTTLTVTALPQRIRDAIVFSGYAPLINVA